LAWPCSLSPSRRTCATGGRVLQPVAQVLRVEPSGPADKAGIVLGDVIVELTGKPALDLDHIQDVLASAQVNDKLPVSVLRAGTAAELSLTLGERPAR